ncbi:MAG: polysaccharide biosynthesis C-terminal domain-containing protein [Bacteroidota bacterium]
MSQARRAVAGATWNHLARGAEFALMYLTSVLLARALGLAENGRLAGALSAAHLIIAAASFGLEASLNRHLPQIPDPQALSVPALLVRRALLVRLLLLAAAGGGAALAASYWCSASAGVRTFLPLVVFYAAVRSLGSLFSVALVARFRTAEAGVLALGARGAELAGVLFLFPLRPSVESALLLLAAGGLLQASGGGFLALRGLFRRGVTGPAAGLLAFGGAYWLNVVVEYFLGRQGDLLLLTLLLPQTTESSRYDVAFSVVQTAQMLFTMGLGGVMFASFARLAGRSLPELDRFYAFMVRTVSLLTIPCFAFLLFNAGSVVLLLYGRAYTPAAELICIMAGFRILSRLAAGPENAEYLLARGFPGRVVAVGIFSAALNVGGNLLLIPIAGAVGAALAGGCANAAANLLGFAAVRHLGKAELEWKSWLRLLLCCVPASGLASVLPLGEGMGGTALRAGLYAGLSLGALRLAPPLRREDAHRAGTGHRALGALAGFLTERTVPPRGDGLG